MLFSVSQTISFRVLIPLFFKTKNVNNFEIALKMCPILVRGAIPPPLSLYLDTNAALMSGSRFKDYCKETVDL